MGPDRQVNRSAASLTRLEEARDRQLQAARDAFPQYRIIEVHGGLCAVPESTEIISAITLDSLVYKLRKAASGQ